MLQRVVMLAFIAATFFTQSSSAQPQSAVRNDLPQPYRTTRDWGQLPPGVAWAAVTAVEPAPDGTIYVIHRCFENSCAGRKEAPILKYDRNGKLLAQLGRGHVHLPARRHRRSRRQPLGDRRARRERQGAPGLQVQLRTARC